MGNGLVEQAERIAHAAVRRNGYQPGTAILRGDSFLFHDFIQLILDLPGAQVFQVELQTARQNGDRYPFRLGRRQQEFYMLGRFLQGLEQGVEAVFREHVDFIDEIDLVPSGSGRILDVIHQVPGFIHLGPGCRVDFDQIDEPAFIDTRTGAALAARFGTDADLAVETLRQDPRQGRLAHAAGTAEQVGMVQSTGIQRIDQHLQDMALSHHIRKRTRPPFTRKNLITHNTPINPDSESVLHRS